MKHQELYIDNLKCSGCGNTITKMLNDLDGVSNTEIFVEEGKIAFDQEETLELESIKKALAKIGYPEQGTSNTIQKAKSYISCAKGRWGE